MDEQKILQKLQQYKLNVNSNQSISDERKSQIIKQLDESYADAKGVFEEFEEIILCIPNEDLEIIINANNQSSQVQLNSSQIASQQSNEGYSGSLNTSMQSQQMSQGQNTSTMASNQMIPGRPMSSNYQQIPAQYPSQSTLQKPYGSSQQYNVQGGQQVPPKMSSTQGYPSSQITPEIRRQYTYQFLLNILKRNMQQISKQDPKYAQWQQKQNQLMEKYQNQVEIDQEYWSFLDKGRFVQYHLQLFEQNIKLCQDPNRREHLTTFLNYFRNKITNDTDLFYYYFSTQNLSQNDKKVLLNEDQNCTNEFKYLLDFLKYSQNQILERQIESIQQQKQIKGFDSFLVLLKELKIDQLYATLETRISYIKKMYQCIQQEVYNFFKSLALEPSLLQERQQQFEKILQQRVLIPCTYREHLILKEFKNLQNDQNFQSYFNLINNILANKDLNQIIGHFQQIFAQQPEIASFNLKRSQIPPRQQSMNSSQGPSGPVRQPEETQPYQKQQQLNQSQYNQITPEPIQQNIPQQQLNSSSQGVSQSQNKPQNALTPQAAVQTNSQQQYQFASQFRNQSQQSMKIEEEGKSNIQSQQQAQIQQIQPKAAYGSQSNYDETPSSTIQQTKQEYQQVQQEQNQHALQPAKQILSQTKTKTKRLLSDDIIQKRLDQLCKDNYLETPSGPETDKIITYLNEVFKVYMKNLIERLLQSSIVENIDNEFRLFCSDKLEAHLVPFRGQSIDKYLLNKQDYTGARDLTFLKYYIVQTENKNIRRAQLEKNDEEIEQACYDSVNKNSLFDKSSMKYDLDRTQRKGCTAADEIKNNIQKIPPQKSKNAKKDQKLESMPQAISLATTNCQRQKITLKNIQLYLEADPIYRKSAILLKTYLQ
ncbi:hypothetical protein TTHERM_00717580 (macronuclear) [Tetrahymena thermophila SB210]|uniref:Uncharacterized protein n=1 Tax=Tetrahymena thermophila (strain SB210) TaxID=312017 RepID=Q23EC0_TETTS|nr:hypothetical protein TTHERM_00717580 [Tetrahymena thermophila SB210]EAR94833.2 hypothetical protein TTHERM_00717580 [Tetrahymena thermophila SB210]|eukprot:XP_001015078.2 hypothetical protein TTHERM_00717580 [Tetrahymena thermophila SB210]